MTDLFMNSVTHDIDLTDGLFRLTTTREEIVRQKLDITLNTYLEEWDFNIDFGTPYFQEIFGKNNQLAADIALKDVILNTDGVREILEFDSSIDNVTRVYTVVFRALIDSGESILVETTI